ncbi:MAG: hypothetical protein ACI9G1_001646 [Pirellulaceae bacterium]|jgi:hypothetical protein
MEQKPSSREPSSASAVPKIIIGCGIVGVAVVAVCGIALFFLVTMFVSKSRDMARRMECNNNLQQLGIGLHNFHDTRRGLPPLVSGPERTSVFVHLLPYCEQAPYFDDLDRRDGPQGDLSDTYLGDAMLDNWNKLNDLKKDALGSIPYHTCPARRTGVQRSQSSGMPGPVLDYGVVMMTKSAQPGDWVDYWDPCQPKHWELIASLLRVGEVAGCPAPDNEAYRRVTSRDTLARAIDGTSNTFVFAEKHVRVGEFGRCCGDTYSAGADGGGLFAADKGRQYSIARSAFYPLTRAPTDFDGKKGRSDGGPLNDFGFGSDHADVVLFGVADGSVRAISRDVDVEMLRGASNVEDGKFLEYD